jgi:NhaC family Na+:H+ antiporter
LAVALLLGVGYGLLQIRAEVLLLGAAAVAGGVARRMGYTWQELQDAIVASIAKGLPAMLIVIVVGALIGSWIAAGTTPMLIYYGLEVIHPRYFLVTTCVVCSIVSLLTGTSWGTIGTMGVAFMGIAEGLGVAPAPAAGAVVAGAYFGDKLSPFSDTTNLAPIAARSNLFDHIRHLLWTTLPAWLVGLAVYLLAGRGPGAAGAPSLARVQAIQETLAGTFSFHPLLLLPPAITLYGAVRKRPVIPGLLLSAATAVLLALVFQGAAPAGEGPPPGPFALRLRDALNSLLEGYRSATGHETVDLLLTRGGMGAMMDATLVALCAFALGGILQGTGMLGVLLARLLQVARTTGSLVATAVGCTILTAVLTGSSFLSILVPGELFAPAFRRRGLAAKNLSRTTEDSGTVVVPLVPWSIAGVFIAGTLDVPTVAYAPWAVLCYCGIPLALLYGFTGIAIAPRIREDETRPGS